MVEIRMEKGLASLDRILFDSRWANSKVGWSIVAEVFELRKSS